jgi:TonB-dependent SusC/RagA subfamily outer membrane receptor
MRIFTIIFCLFVSLNALGQVKDTALADSSKIVFHERSIPSNTKLGEPLYVVDGVIYKGDVNRIDSRDILTIKVLKGAPSINLYGKAGANGVVLIETKHSKTKFSAKRKPIVVLDGKIFKRDIKTIDPNTIATISVLKGDKASLIWGHAGANGAVIITTKAAMRKFRPDTIR